MKIDKRKETVCKMTGAMSLFGLVYAFATVWAASATSIDEHASDLMRWEWGIIIGLVGILCAIIGYVYVTGIGSIKESNRALAREFERSHDEMSKAITRCFEKIDHLDEKKLDKDGHEDMDHSSFCSICRKAD